jgi:hypothetical protein
MHKKLVEKMD